MAQRIIEIRGLEELRRDLAQASTIIAEETDRAMQRSVQRVTSDVKRGTPVDMDKLRGSITWEVRPSVGIVGTNVKYAPYVEFGTRPHFPPLSALQVWARRHGTTAWQVAIGIARHGTRAHEMFKQGLEMNVENIQHEFQSAVDRVIQRLAGK